MQAELAPFAVAVPHHDQHHDQHAPVLRVVTGYPIRPGGLCPIQPSGPAFGLLAGPTAEAMEMKPQWAELSGGGGAAAAAAGGGDGGGGGGGGGGKGGGPSKAKWAGAAVAAPRCRTPPPVSRAADRAEAARTTQTTAAAATAAALYADLQNEAVSRLLREQQFQAP